MSVRAQGIFVGACVGLLAFHTVRKEVDEPQRGCTLSYRTVSQLWRSAEDVALSATRLRLVMGNPDVLREVCAHSSRVIAV